MDEGLIARFHEALPAGLDHVSMRAVERRSEDLAVRDDVVMPPSLGHDVGVMITVHEGGGLGYAATPDLSAAGLRAAVERARAWAQSVSGRAVVDTRAVQMPAPRGAWSSPVREPWEALPLAERLGRLRQICAAAKGPEALVFREASVMWSVTDTLFVTADGGEVRQRHTKITPEIEVFAARDGHSQRRTLGGLRGCSRLGGAEVLDDFAMEAAAARVRDEALALLDAPECPSGVMDLLLAPDQMMLQIHESIGHPLELDRILGDERNYAGTSFVTLDMFGRYQYGSEVLNVSFDPDEPGEYAGYGWDDDGLAGRRQLLIEKGLLVRGLGGTLSQARSGVPGVANARATSWNRPPIDRMANLNIEPGEHSFAALVAGIERGVYMETNLSWSIDDSRNKFQFGCEFGREIIDGQLGRVVKNPNYRGISASFWRDLARVGDRSTHQVLGTPFCGKGEPNQVIGVGHASPACHFAGVDVFGGAA
jgi:predicted Zn-dependent protease